jgi:hypothetical protein
LINWKTELIAIGFHGDKRQVSARQHVIIDFYTKPSIVPQRTVPIPNYMLHRIHNHFPCHYRPQKNRPELYRAVPSNSMFYFLVAIAVVTATTTAAFTTATTTAAAMSTAVSTAATFTTRRTLFTRARNVHTEVTAV